MESELPDLDIKCIVSAAESGGAVAIFEEIVQPGIGPPRHTHREQTEVFHVISGTILFEIDGKQTEVSSGGAAVVPAGTVHAFKNVGDAPATIHFELIPAGKSEESFHRLLSERIENVGAFFDQYGMDLVGPPLE